MESDNSNYVLILYSNFGEIQIMFWFCFQILARNGRPW